MQCSKWVGVALLVLGLASSAQASYTSAQLAMGPEILADGSVHYIAVFSGAGEQDVKQDVVVAATGNVQDALRLLADKLNHTTSKDRGLPTVGTVFDVRPVGSVDPSTDDVAYAAFQVLVTTWRATVVKQSLGNATSQDAADAAAAIVAVYDKAAPALQARYNQLLFILARGI